MHVHKKLLGVLFCIVLMGPTTLSHTPKPPQNVGRCYACGTGMKDLDCKQKVIEECKEGAHIPGAPGLPPGSGGDRAVTRPPKPDELIFVCMKRVLLLGFNSKVDRSCWFPPPEDNNETRRMECKTEDGVTQCLCDTDLCNKAAISGSGTIFGIVIGVLLGVRFALSA